MVNKRKAVTTLAVAILFASLIIGSLSYYFNEVRVREAKEAAAQAQSAKQNAEATALKSEIADLKAQMTNLTGLVNQLTSSDLVTALETHEMTGSASSEMGGLVSTPVPFNYLWIEGSVTNEGSGYAVAAGLQVDAYSAAGVLEANVTVPFTGSTFGSDNATTAFVTQKYGVSDFALNVLDSGQKTHVDQNIFHEGIAANWTVTPICWSYSATNETLQNSPLSSQVSYLQSQVTNLDTLIANLTTTKLVASLNVRAYPAMSQNVISYSSSLWIVGTVTNVGDAVAYNTGIHVIAYTAQGTLEINMTCPLEGLPVTYNATTRNTVPQLSPLNSGYGYDSYSSSNSQSVALTIYTQEQVSNWTITPIWTNTP